MRSFISIEIPEEIKKKIEDIQKQLPKFAGKITKKRNLHLTLKFLGEVSDDEIFEINKRLMKINLLKFNAEIYSIGVFSEREIRIVWLSIKNCDKLQKEIDDKLGNFFPKEKRFMGHLTIARVKSVKDKKKFLEELSRIKISKIKFDVDKFYLRKSVLTSNGSNYKNIKIYSLKYN